jgi:hypothetical protein
VSFAAVGYETVSVTTTPQEFNNTAKLWYEKVFPSWEWIPKGKECEGSFIKVQDCTHRLEVPHLHMCSPCDFRNLPLQT